MDFKMLFHKMNFFHTKKNVVITLLLNKSTKKAGKYFEEKENNNKCNKVKEYGCVEEGRHFSNKQEAKNKTNESH